MEAPVPFETDAFVAELLRALDGARRRVLVQVMTFDGDASGRTVADRLVAAAHRGVEVTVLVDSFAVHTVSDRPARHPSVREETAATWAMFDDLRAAGCRVLRTRPYGPLWVFAPARNHKKAFVVDDVAYLGGVNLSDHNFSWHDLMLAFDDPAIVEAVVADLARTAAGGRGVADGPLLTNRALEDRFGRLLDEATEEIVVASPYAIDVALIRRLRRSRARRKRVVVATDNNFRLYRLMGPYLFAALRRAGVELVAYPSFSHAKFVLVDDHTALVGSSNYGHHSFRCNDELGVVIDDAAVVERLRREFLGGVVPVESLRSGPARWLLGALVAHVFHVTTGWYGATLARRGPVLARD